MRRDIGGLTMRRMLIVLVAWGVGVGSVQAALETRPVDYQHNGAELQGFLAYDTAFHGPRPGILVVHEWKGLNEYAKGRAEQLAQLGYIAFAVDMYGKGIEAKDHAEAARLSGIYRSDRQLMRARATAGLEVLRQQELTDEGRLAAIGYCFGGTTVLELARSGADLKGVVSFHGGLDSLHPEDARQIRGQVLVLHGEGDTFSPKEAVEALKAEMEAAGVAFRMVLYPGAVHSFTVPTAGNDPSTGVAYNAEADQQSWLEMLSFFDDIFGGTPSLHADL